MRDTLQSRHQDMTNDMNQCKYLFDRMLQTKEEELTNNL